jgi:hypothetical protein
LILEVLPATGKKARIILLNGQEKGKPLVQKDQSYQIPTTWHGRNGEIAIFREFRKYFPRIEKD